MGEGLVVTGVEQLLSGKRPPTWPVWFTYIRAVFSFFFFSLSGFGFNRRRCHQAVLRLFFFRFLLLFFLLFGLALRVKIVA